MNQKSQEKAPKTTTSSASGQGKNRPNPAHKEDFNALLELAVGQKKSKGA